VAANDTPDAPLVPSWLTVENTGKALAANPDYAAQIAQARAGSADIRSPAQWLYDDLLGGDPNTSFLNATMQASGQFGNLFGTMLPSGDNPVNPGVNAPDSFNAAQSAPDASGILNQIQGMFSSFLGILGKPSYTSVNAPVSTTTTTENVAIDNSTHLTDNSVDNSVFNSSVGISWADFMQFFDRFPQLASVPAGGNGVVTPAAPTVGYGQNVAQSGPRLGGQTIASVGGLELNTAGVGVGSWALPWGRLLLLVGLGVGVWFILKRFFK